MRVLFTGQVGLNKGAYLQKASELAGLRGWKLDFETIGQSMIDNYVGKIDDATILNLPGTELDLLRQITWKQVLGRLKRRQEDPNQVFVINTHAVFRWHHGLIPGLDLDLVAQFAPDLVAVAIDDVVRVKQGLQERGTDFFELWELFAWREEEIWFSKFVAKSVAKLAGRMLDSYCSQRRKGQNCLQGF